MSGPESIGSSAFPHARVEWVVDRHWRDSKHDLVLIAVDGDNARALTLEKGSKEGVGDTVFAVGNPQGLEGTFSTGIISGIRQFGPDSLLQITAPISPGSSGGPVLNSEGRVVGVAVATFKEGQNLNFAIPSSYLQDLLGREMPEPKPLVSKLGGITKSIFSAPGETQSVNAVAVKNFTYDGNLPGGAGPFSLSLVNLLREPIKNIYCLVIFYDTSGSPIDVSAVKYPFVIPAGLAKRITSRVDESVENLNCPQRPFPHQDAPPRKPKGRIDFRVLNFEMAE